MFSKSSKVFLAGFPDHDFAVLAWFRLLQPHPILLSTSRTYETLSNSVPISENRETTTTTETKPNLIKETKQAEIQKCYNRLDLSFQNTNEAYRSKRNTDLLSVPTLVQRNQQILKWTRKFTGPKLFRWIMRSSFYGHFVAGQNQNEVKPIVTKMRRFGVKSIMDYRRPVAENVPETLGPIPTDITQYKSYREFGDRREGVVSARTYFYDGEPECDRNLETFLNCIDAVSHATDGTGFAAIKLTALGRPQLLLQLSEVLEQSQQFYRMLTGSTWENLVKSRLSQAEFLDKLRDFGIRTDNEQVQTWFDQADFDADGFVDLYEWGRLLDQNIRLGSLFQILNLRTGRMEPLIKQLTGDEEWQFQAMMQRLNSLAKRAEEQNVRLMIDAEQSYFQPAISRLALELMRKCNKEKPVVFNTYQCYLKSAMRIVQVDMHLARREKFHFGAKLVRGAYMEQERRRAATLGYEDPINPTYEDTSSMYDRVLGAILDEVEAREPGGVSVMAATHNEQSVRYAVKEMKRRGIGPDERIVCFGQLYGMCDQDGPSSLVTNVQKERQLMWTELKRRLKNGQWIYKIPDMGGNGYQARVL